MMDSTVFVVDDDKEMLSALRQLFRSVHLNVELYSSIHEFVERYQPESPGCIILDMRMPGMSGLDLQAKLVEQGIRMPIIVMAGHGDVPTAVRAMKGGAFEFIEKPFDDHALLDCVNRCLELDRNMRQEAAWQAEIGARIARLTLREREVLELIVAGKTNKAVATELDISIKTVEVHRAKVMEKMQAGSMAGLLQMYFAFASPAGRNSA